ncbi:IS1096 element passenger TnpR family protein [Aeromonas sobria]|jgi:hypothetical protein|uniref:IS1096 element passenger TnpR family protein n=1 Tax=Aeromonas sobria TaxID=646 RepID=UPI0026EC8727|nr:hypothetical protein [Aeromonas sobria]
MLTPLTIRLLGGGYNQSLSPWECVLEIATDATLAELHDAIQQATGFENDHLYMFMIARTSNSRRARQFDCDEETYTTTIAEMLAQAKGLKAFYLFDFGDSWLFQVVPSRKKPHPPVAGVSYPRLVSESGKKPIQYPDWDQWDDEDIDDA